MNATLSCGACTAAPTWPMGAPHPQRSRRIAAVSGGIGSGKLSVTRIFVSLGAVTANADTIAQEIFEPGEPALSEVARAFGGDLLKQNGSLNHAFLASRVLGGEGANERVARLSAITHPFIEARAWSIPRGASEGSLVVYDILLLIEGDHMDRFGVVVTADASIGECVKRLEGRGFVSEDTRARIRAQASSQEHCATATIWTDNEGSSGDPEEVARFVYGRWLILDVLLTV